MIFDVYLFVFFSSSKDNLITDQNSKEIKF